DLVAGPAGGAAGGVVVRSQFLEPGAGGADEDPGDLADDAGDRDDGFLLAALAGGAPVHGAEPGLGVRGGRAALAQRAAQVGVAVADAAGPGALPGLQGTGGQAAQAAAWPGVGNCDGSVPSSSMRTRALHRPTPVISSSRSARLSRGCPRRRSRG